MKMVISLLVLLNILNFPQIQTLTETESLVLENLKSNKPINFINDIYPSNILSGLFIKSVLSNEGSIVGSDFKTKEIVIMGAIVVGEIDISNLEIDISLKFHKNFFRDDIKIDNTQLNKIFQIVDCKFDGNVDFGQSTFNEKTFIRNCTINGDANFSYCKFLNYSDIQNSKFFGSFIAHNANFSNSTFILENDFYKNSNFNWTKFEKLELKNTKFRENVSFNSIEVTKTVFIEKNIFLGKVDFLDAKVFSTGYFDNNLFNDSTIFNSMRIGGKLIFDGSVFNEHTEFIGITVDDNASFNNTIFHKSVNFLGSVFKQQIQLVNSTLKSISNFMDIDVSGGAYFIGVVFHDDAVFSGSTFKKSVSISNSKFLGKTYMQYMDIEGLFDASNTQFRKIANFEFSKIGEELILIGAIFNDSVSFRSLEVKTLFDLYKSKFNRGGDFSQMKIGGDIWGEFSNFNGKINFYATQVEGDVYLKNAKFEGINSCVKFNSVKIMGLMNIENVTFSDSADFINLFVQSQFQAKNSKFLSVFKSISFSGMESPGGTYFNTSTFFGQIELNSINTSGLYLTSVNAKSDVQIKNATIDHLNIDSANIVDLDLTATNIKQSLKLKYSKFNRLIADRINVSNNLVIDSLRVRQYVSFINSKVTTLDLSNFFYPVSKDSMNFDGFDFNYIANGKNPENWKILFQIFNDSKFSASTYSNLENYYKNLGMTDISNTIFKKRKAREIEESDNCIDITFSYLYKIFVGFGRNPEYSIIWSFIIIVLNYSFFSEKYLIKKDELKTNVKFHRVVYAIDVFLPVINFKEEDNWIISSSIKLKQNSLLFWWVSSKILGWILTIMLVISFTNLVK